MAEDSAIRSTTSGTQTPVHSALSRVKANGLHTSDSTDSLAAAGKRADAQRTYLGGSKALDHLAKLIVSCETFFHPSNHGAWTTILTTFIHTLTWEFTKRWMEEEKPECKTPIAWRLTPGIKREFVLIIRSVALIAMFSKDGTSTNATRGALRSLSILEPDLIIPPIIERAVPSLQGLEETHRTTAVLRALSGITHALVTNPKGRLHIPGLLDLCLPGIDLNDPNKTASVVTSRSVLPSEADDLLPVALNRGLPHRPHEPDSTWRSE
jgi:proteasome activator subunit 4